MKWLWDYWPLALAFIALILFGIPEWAAIHYGGPTFSRFMRTVADSGPWGKIWTFAWGGLTIGLLVHFSGWCVPPCGGG